MRASSNQHMLAFDRLVDGAHLRAHFDEVVIFASDAEVVPSTIRCIDVDDATFDCDVADRRHQLGDFATKVVDRDDCALRFCHDCLPAVEFAET